MHNGNLFQRLDETVSQQLIVQTNYLRNEINKQTKDNKIAWNEMINFEEYIICDPKIGVRQDSILDLKTGEEVISFPNKASYRKEFLNEKSVELDFMEQAYLNELMVIAHVLHDQFYSAIKQVVFEEIKENKEDENRVEYRFGKIKKIERCQGIYASICQNLFSSTTIWL